MDSFTVGRITGQVIFCSLVGVGALLAHRATKRSRQARLAAMQHGGSPEVSPGASARVVVVQAPDGSTQPMNEHYFAQAVALGRIHSMTPVSLDGGRTFLAASVIAARLAARGDDALALVLPNRVETLSAVAGYVALFSFLFFGGPLTVMAMIAGFDLHSTLGARLGIIALALFVGPVPPALLALLGLRAIGRDPTFRGKGRAVFALVLAALMLVGCLVALAGLALAHA